MGLAPVPALVSEPGESVVSELILKEEVYAVVGTAIDVLSLLDPFV